MAMELRANTMDSRHVVVFILDLRFITLFFAFCDTIIPEQFRKPYDNSPLTKVKDVRRKGDISQLFWKIDGV